MAALRLGWRELVEYRRINLVMAQMIGVVLLIFLSLEGYRTGLATEYTQTLRSRLIVQESNSMGEFYGSRISPKLGQRLLALGVSEIIPEIHAITGTSVRDAVLLRGVSLDRYQDVEAFVLLEGRALQPGDRPRLTMIGRKLAENRGVGAGDTLLLRGREFTVIGIFEIGTYIDNEAWISLDEAQRLLGWEEDISIFVIPDEGVLQEGDEVEDGFSVVRKGETAGNYADRWDPILDMVTAAASAMGVVAVITLTNVLLRLARLRQRELAILRAVGFGKMTLVGYLLVQAAGVTGLGWLLGMVGMFVLATITNVDYLAAEISFVINWTVLLGGVGLAAIMTIGGVIAPVWWLQRLDVASLLRAE